MTRLNRIRLGICVCGIACFLLALVRVHAIYRGPDIENVPIERLIQNLGQIAAKEPQDSQIRFNLARAHAMAFARKLPPAQTVPVVRGREYGGIWFGTSAGPETEFVPFKAVPAADPAAQKLATEHLARAIELYRQGLELDPANLAAKLGYAWCLDQSGDKGKAITAYRHVVAEGWAAEQGALLPLQTSAGPGPRGSAGPGFRSITAEAASYLLPLLDPRNDQDEIAALRERIGLVNNLGRGITPIVIPLNDGLTPSEMMDRSARVAFDADGSGIPRRWTWITPEAGWLVHAQEGSRPVTSALQMFGNVTFWLFWDNGYQALRSLDDDADGHLKGSELDGLAIWQDANSNGVADNGEVKPLAAWEIQSLSWHHETTPARDDYAAFSPAGVTFGRPPGSTNIRHPSLFMAGRRPEVPPGVWPGV